MYVFRIALLVVLSVLIFAGGVDAADGSAYESDIRAFIKEADSKYPFFRLKGIGADWTRAKRGLVQAAKSCESDEAFMLIVYDGIRILRDGHMGVRESRVEMPKMEPRYYPGISFLEATEGRVVVMYGPKGLNGKLKTGTVVTKINGTDARQYLDTRAKEAWREGGFFSSKQRASLFEYRKALRSDEGDSYTITYIEEGNERDVVVTSDIVSGGWPHTYNMPGDLKRVGRSFFYTRLTSDVGYMYLRRVDSSVVQGMREAAKQQPDVLGWIVDLRGNGGGGYDKKLIERIGKLSRPVAVIVDAGCISAGETLARDFRARADARLFGSRTAGSSSSKRAWTFPSGIASVTFSVRSRWRNDRKPIEFNGIEPDVVVQAVPEEVEAGKNSAIIRAQEYIISKAGKGQAKKVREKQGSD